MVHDGNVDLNLLHTGGVMSNSRSENLIKETPVSLIKKPEEVQIIEITVHPVLSYNELLDNFEQLTRKIFELQGKKDGSTYSYTTEIDQDLNTSIEVKWK